MTVDQGSQVGLEQLMALLDHTSAVIYMRGLDGRYLLVNREYERLFNVPREDIVGLTDFDVFPPELAEGYRANDLLAISHGSPLRFEEYAPSGDGEHVYLTVKFPLKDAAGHPYAICGISTDITDRKRAEEEVHRLNDELEERVRQRTADLEATTRELDAFAYSVSHDLRAPLRSLAGFSEVLLQDYADRLDDIGQGYLRRIEANATRMAQMIDDLLDLSRTTRVELTREIVDISALARDVLAELADGEPHRDVQVTVADGLLAEGDPHMFRLLLYNLLGNAWKFTARRAPATIRVAEVIRDATAVFEVSDNGAGFDMRYVAKLFDPFQRLHSAAEFEGTGVGLAIVQRIVQRHGGRIWAESALGAGSRFFFTLGADRPVGEGS